MNKGRQVFCEDALFWLKNHETQEGESYVASMPDISEFPGLTLEQWKNWFIEMACLILSRCPDLGVTVFYQSDIKYEGEWVDKAYLCQKAAEALGHKLLWHKIVCRSPAGTTTFGRPAYSHIVCFSKKFTVDVAKSTPDVLLHIGEKTWQRGMGLGAALMIARFMKEEVGTKTLVNPFCGEGSMLVAANAYQMDSVGVERSLKRAEKARKLSLNENRDGFN